MKIPPGYTQETVLEAVDKAIAILAPTFVFGYMDIDDVRQEGYLEAIKLLDKGTFDPSRPLANYVYVHLYRRYVNMRRNLLRRSDYPCDRCHRGDNCTPDGPCGKYREWRDRQDRKSNIMKPLPLDHIADETEKNARVASTVVSDVEMSELLGLIDEKLPVHLRETYLQMRDGVTVPRPRRRQVEEAVKEILRGDLDG